MRKLRTDKPDTSDTPTRAKSIAAQSRFIDEYQQSGNVKYSCLMAGISRQTFYDWLKRYPSFAQRIEASLDDVNDTLEYAAHERAVRGVESYVVSQGKLVYGPDGNPLVERKYSDTLLQTLLRARMPHKYLEKRQLEMSGPNGAPIQVQHLQHLSNTELDTLEQLAHVAQERGEHGN